MLLGNHGLCVVWIVLLLHFLETLILSWCFSECLGLFPTTCTVQAALYIIFYYSIYYEFSWMKRNLNNCCLFNFCHFLASMSASSLSSIPQWERIHWIIIFLSNWLNNFSAWWMSLILFEVAECWCIDWIAGRESQNGTAFWKGWMWCSNWLRALLIASSSPS